MGTLFDIIICIALAAILAVHAVIEVIKAYTVSILMLLAFIAVAVPLILGIQYALTLIG